MYVYGRGIELMVMSFRSPVQILGAAAVVIYTLLAGLMVEDKDVQLAVVCLFFMTVSVMFQLPRGPLRCHGSSIYLVPLQGKLVNSNVAGIVGK